MSLLTIVQDAADECGVAKPTTVIGASDTTVRRLLALAKRGGKKLAERHTWSSLVTEATFTTVAAEDQGALDTIAPGFKWFVGETIWDRTQKLPIGGSLTPQEWQRKKAQTLSGPYSQFRIKNNHLYFYPAPAAGLSAAFEYGSKYWCQSSTGTGQTTWESDSDTGKLDEDLLTMDLVWRFLQRQGLDYGEAFRDFENSVALAIGRDASPEVLDMGDQEIIRAIGVPDGNWNI